MLSEGSNANFNLLKSNSLNEFCAKIGQNLITEVIINGEIIHKNTNLIV